MKTRSAFAALLLGAALAFQGTAALAVNPDEVLSDPVLEKRARTISGELRCMVCQNESIDDSNAELARDLRILVRDRLKEGDSDEQVMDFIVDRYGEFVLLKPRLNARTVLLWGISGRHIADRCCSAGFRLSRTQAGGEAPQPLTESEKAELSRLLDGK
ncbi:cytochrome c-type biogenesis protein CcmH [Ochrobactrum intermedium]|nr:cytochrome c-type biogenesis protein CcmH [Brucella intermedia]